MESLTTQIVHWLGAGGTFAILGILLSQHKIVIRAKDRLNILWFHHCVERKEPYISLDGNGEHR